MNDKRGDINIAILKAEMIVFTLYGCSRSFDILAGKNLFYPQK